MSRGGRAAPPLLRPPAPFIELVELTIRSFDGTEGFLRAYAAWHGLTVRTALRDLADFRARALRVNTSADRLCLFVGVHPLQVWAPGTWVKSA